MLLTKTWKIAALYAFARCSALDTRSFVHSVRVWFYDIVHTTVSTTDACGLESGVLLEGFSFKSSCVSF